jgi:class 3 adenylate cyclase
VSVPQPPSGTLTFPILGHRSSARRWEEPSDEIRDVVGKHDELLRAAFESHNGYVFATGGNGFAAALGRAADAAAAAEVAQTAIARLEHVKVRMGINTVRCTSAMVTTSVLP